MYDAKYPQTTVTVEHEGKIKNIGKMSLKNIPTKNEAEAAVVDRALDALSAALGRFGSIRSCVGVWEGDRMVDAY